MNDMNPRAVIGANNPPDPIDAATAPFADAIEMAQGWLDGEPVTNEQQMAEVDAILADIRKASTAIAAAQKADTAPLHDAWKARIAAWKPTVDDLDRMKKGLAAAVDVFKRKLAAEKEAAKRAAYDEARRAEREAEALRAKADASNIEAQREADAAMRAAIDAKKAAAAANKDTVKGLRTVTRYEITDHRDLLNWIARNRRGDLTAFIEDWAKRNHKPDPAAAGLRVWQEKEAY